MNRIAITAAAMLTVLGAATASAQYQGPGARNDATPAVAHTVAEVLRSPIDDQPVELTGTLVRQTGRETYLFRDDTGEIQVEIDREDFPAGQPVGPETRVLITGEVDTRFMRKPEIDVESLRIATSPN